MKTAVTVLQEMMVKLGQTPDYECIAQSGPQHLATFEYRCAALGAAVTAAARSKKEAKQEAARLMLRRLALLGHPVPPPYAAHDQTDAEEGAAASARGAGEAGGGGARSYVALLKELCEEYRLPGAEYELVGDTGPPHLRHFTVAARVGQFSRSATATTKKAARQIAADQLYSYLRENLARLTKDFVEEDALVRAHAKAMERFQEARDERLRPDLGQRVADYHLEPEAWDAALRALEAEHDGGLEGALAALGLQAEATTLEAAGAPLHVLTLDAAAPPLAFAGASPQRARAAAARYLRRALARRRPPATPELA
ncbi:interferon-inducible double-stranded RNA-dependent protein kinase activator A homolog isoform X2 [Ostrinia nubilalis]|uniref:interferon-inducible double-stranded RNA-dependent protein kinase activator A homolog isoform X7 n=1 Tax=Ostrinia furnacalis TaxID=93504 RepID=UPI00103B5CAD|nr:interferon-inducible double-stranded RNA-dependent protein kinase activator A homolog isoform X7 [Ostrinia furnacalis]